MRARATALVAVLLAGAIAPAATAAPPCKLMKDSRGDSRNGPPLDILSADVAANSQTITVVIRLATLERFNQEAVTGQAWYVEWKLRGVALPLYLGVHVTPTAESFHFGQHETVYRSFGLAIGIVDYQKREIRISAPLHAWGDKGPMRKGTKLLEPTASSHWFIGVALQDKAVYSLSPADESTSPRPYVVGTATCVAVGR